MRRFIKRFVLVLIMSIITISVNAESDYSLSTNLYKTIASDAESIIQSGTGLQVSLHRKNLFLYLSKDVHQVRFAGQSGPDVNLYSFGFGMQRKVGKYLMLSIDVGWYEPMFKEMGEPQPLFSSPFAEGLQRYLNKYLVDDGIHPYIPNWDYYTLNYKGSIGGKLSLAFEYPITERLSFNIMGGYRYLKLQENVQGRHYLDHGGGIDWSKHYWTVRYDRDFSGWMIGGMIVFNF